MERISASEASLQRGSEGVLYQGAADPTLLYVRGAVGNLAANSVRAVASPFSSAEVDAVRALVSGAGNPSAATYDGSNRVTAFAIGSVTFTVAGWGTSSIVVAGSDGSTKTITLDGSGRFLAAT